MRRAQPIMPYDCSSSNNIELFFNSFYYQHQKVDASVKRLHAAGFQKLSEREEWQLERGGSYFFTRNGTTILAFTVGSQFPTTAGAFTVLGAHTDSPCLKIKPVLFFFVILYFKFVLN